MNKKTSLVISLIVGVVLFILVYLKTGFLEILETFSHASLIKLSLYLLISILIIFFLVLRWKFIIRAHGFDVPLYRLVMYKLSGYAISYITPSAHIGGSL